MSDAFPRVTSIPCTPPYYDDSCGELANTGPYWDAIRTELMPHLEAKYG
jgi:hypothetical protein